MRHTLLNGDNIDVLKKYPDNYFDAVVTDPPYGLGKEPDAVELMQSWIETGYYEIKGSGFMGKEWDAFVPQPIFWKEVFRVLKPGGHVLAFYGTRTYDWGVMAMRFAGFEVRDTIYWHYGSGFPKSHNISKAIDKQDTNEFKKIVGDTIKKHRNKLGLSMDELCEKLSLNNIGHGGMVNHYENGRATPTIEIWKNLCKILNINEIENYEKEKNGRLLEVGIVENPISWFGNGIIKEVTTEQAKQWEGWGSALKPASEPIVMARKPLEKGLSIAENVLKYGTGAINIDGCRVGLSIGDDPRLGGNGSWKTDKAAENVYEGGYEGKNIASSPLGRFPANLILTCTCDDENNHNEDCPIKIIDEQSGESKSSKSNKLYINNTENRSVKNSASGHRSPDSTYEDAGGASRFFYCAKASKAERNKGLEGFEEKARGGKNKMMGDFGKFKTGSGNDRTIEFKNFHPTVKPVKLMQYLVRLVTPPNGIVLDPFCGSGTTGIACKLEGFEFVGIEQDAEYIKIAEARIANYPIEIKQTLLF